VFVRVDSAIERCREHLDATGARNTEVETFLVGYLVTIIHAEFEQHVSELLRERTRSSDPHLTAWGAYATGRIAKKFSVSDLSGYLRAFDESCRMMFANAIHDTPEHLAYDRIESTRQLVAHARDTSLTFDDVEQSYREACAVLDAFAKALASGLGVP
jgi:hypothetical protein